MYKEGEEMEERIDDGIFLEFTGIVRRKFGIFLNLR